MRRVDYSEFVEALADGEEFKANKLLGEIMPRLREYLEVVMGADENSARECAQQAFLDVYEQIRKENIRDQKYIFSYLLKACRHEYLRFSKYQHRFKFEEDSLDEMAEPAEQMDNLLDQERQEILKKCLDELDEDSRVFIIRFISKPDTTTKEAGALFKLSGANVRTKKSRITGKLHECYKRKVDR